MRWARGLPLATPTGMSRDYTQLRVFQLADDLVVDVYRLTRALPPEEKFGLQAQVRRAAVSVPTNIVEGSVRRSEAHYMNYLETALGSACEARYLIGLASRLELLEDADCQRLVERYSTVIKGLAALVTRIQSDLERRTAHRQAATARRRQLTADS